MSSFNKDIVDLLTLQLASVSFLHLFTSRTRGVRGGSTNNRQLKFPPCQTNLYTSLFFTPKARLSTV